MNRFCIIVARALIYRVFAILLDGTMGRHANFNLGVDKLRTHLHRWFKHLTIALIFGADSRMRQSAAHTDRARTKPRLESV